MPQVQSNSESTPMELSDTPLSQAEGLEALMGFGASSDELEQAPEDSPLEASDDIEQEDVESEEATEEEAEEVVEESASSEDEQAFELSDEEFEYFGGIKDWAEAQGFTDIEQLRSGVLMQSDYTQKTQEHANTVKEWTDNSAKQTQELGQALELAQAILYGEAASFEPAEMQALKESDPMAYEEKRDAFFDFQTKKTQVDAQIAKVTQEYQAQQDVIRQASIEENRVLFQQMVPDAIDPVKAGEIQKSIVDYWTGIGGDVQFLSNVTGAMELKVLYDAAQNTSVAKEVAGTKVSKAKKGKRYIKSGSPKSKAQKATTSRKAKMEGLTTASTSQAAKKSGENLILDMLNSGEL